MLVPNTPVELVVTEWVWLPAVRLKATPLVYEVVLPAATNLVVRLDIVNTPPAEPYNPDEPPVSAETDPDIKLPGSEVVPV